MAWVIKQIFCKTNQAMHLKRISRLTSSSNPTVTLPYSIQNLKWARAPFSLYPALIAEEFEVSLDQVTIKLTNGEKEFGNSQSAGGSSSVRTSYTDLRKIGASAKEVFIQAAATKWNVDASSCFAENGRVFHKPTKKYFSYSDLVEDAAKLELT
jgi:CO/xanthine dehydrogenase Mo-binding subunit